MAQFPSPYSRIELSSSAYQAMLDLLGNLHYSDCSATASDSRFLRQDAWLMDTSVQEEITPGMGLWHIHLLFIHYHNPLQFRRRWITSHVQKNKAQLMASFMRRLAAKDQRGTIPPPFDRFELDKN